jgi:hypothetical protein
MRRVIYILAFHLFTILFFSFLYFSIKDRFVLVNNSYKKEGFEHLDYILLSTTIQSGIGFSDLHPVDTMSKILVVVQKLVMISSNVFTIYFFSL